MRKSFTFLASIFVLTLCLSLNALAQRTTGDIQGTVTDANGAVVPGASVTVTGRDVGLTRTVSTDNEGIYRVLQLPSGHYSVSIAAISGLATQSNDVQVSINNAAVLDFTMSASASAVVNVTAEGNVIDPTETKEQTTFSQRQIEALPKGTGFSSLLKNSVAVRNEPLAGGFIVNGATGPENSFLIDGQETQNYYNGLLASNQDIPYQSVQEIQAKTSGFEAEFGGATGGVISAVTKSGSDTYHAEFGMQFNTQKLDAGPRPVTAFNSTTVPGTGQSVATTGQYIEQFPQARDSGLSEYPSIQLSGPIIKRHLWFYLDHNPRIVTTTRTTNYVQGFGNFRVPRVLSPTLLALGATDSQTVTQRTNYNYSFAKLDASLFKTIRLTSSFTWNPIVNKHPLLGGTFANGSPGTANLGGTTYQGADLAKFQGGRQNSSNFRSEGIWTPTSNIVVDVRYSHGFQNEKISAYGIADDPRINCTFVPAAYVAQAGCAQGFSNVGSNDKTGKNISLRNSWNAEATYLFNGLGHHELKGGFSRDSLLNDISTGSVFPVGQGRAYLYYGQGLTGIDCNFTYVQWSADCPAGSNLYPLPTLAPGVTVIGSGVNYQFGSSGTATDIAKAIFVQDKWQPTSRLTFNLGVRLENEQIPAFNANRIDLRWGWGAKIAPRIGVAYALTKDGKTKISGLYGKFFDRMKFALPQGSFGGQFYHVSYFYITSDHPQYSYYTVANLHGSYTFPNGGQCPITPTGENSYRCDQDYRIASNIPNSDPLTNGAVDPNIKPYEQREITIEFQREIVRDTNLSVRYLHRNLVHVIEDAGIPTSSGEAYVIGNPGEGLAASIPKALGYNQVAVPQRIYNAVQAEVDTRFVRNFSLNVNYTWSRLWGNYSGLANPDELTGTGTPRLDPNVSRGFDEPWVGFTAAGHPDNGLLPLDRTHVIKASGTYEYGWRNNKTNATDLSFFYTIESGTPRTTYVTIIGIPIPETTRNDLGRTPMFSQLDLNLTHKIKFGSDNKYAIALDFNVLNALNQDIPLAFQQNKSSSWMNLTEFSITPSGNKVTATNILTSSGVLTQYAAAEAVVCANPSAPGVCGNPALGVAPIQGVNVARSLSFGQPIAWQDPRSVRFGLRFMF